MDQALQWAAENLSSPADLTANLVATFVTVVLLAVGRLVVLKVIGARTREPGRAYQLRRVTAWVFGVLGGLMVGRIWLVSFETLGTVLGLISAGLAIALREPVTNLFGWVYVMTRRPFDLGDRVEVGKVKGDVVDQRVFDFSVMEVGGWLDADVRTGRVVRIPNAQLFRVPVAVYQQGWYEEIWNEVVVVLTFESNWREAKTMLQRILLEVIGDLTPRINREMSERASRYFILADDHLEPQVLVCSKEHGVAFTLRYLCNTGEKRRTEANLWEAVLAALDERPDMELAYPTRRVVDLDGGGRSPDGSRRQTAVGAA